MELLAKTLRYETSLLLILLAGTVAYKLLIQQINVKGLFRDTTGDRSLSPARVQLLLASVSMAAYYVFLVIDSKEAGKLPDVPKEFLIALTGSNSIYLAGKLYGALTTKLRLGLSPIKPEEQPQKEV